VPKSKNAWPTSSLVTSETYNNRPLLAEIPRTLSGNVATMIGWTYGGGSIRGTTEGNIAPFAPGHGQRGHDHSGGVHGRPLYRSIATTSFGGGSEAESITWLDGSDQTQLLFFNIPASSSAYLQTGFAPWPIWVPGCDPGPLGAYQYLGVTILGQIETATNMQTADALIFDVENSATGSLLQVSDSSITTTGLFTARAAGLVTRPGTYQTISIPRVRLQTTATVATRTLAFGLMGVEVGVWSTTQ